MTLPVVPNTALLGNADLHIRALAYAADARLGVGYKYVPFGGRFTIDANSNIDITVPMGGYVTGALCELVGYPKWYGRVDYTSGGVLIPPTLLNIFPHDFSPFPDHMHYSVRTSLWRNAAGTAGYGSQKARPEYPVDVVGVAWGAV